MKKIFLFFLAFILITGCSSNNSSGSITDFSKKYLSKGYIINVYRSVDSVSDALEDMGKGNVKMIFNVLVDYYSTIDYSNQSDYIKKQIVSDLKVVKSPKMGIVSDLYSNYQSYMDADYKVVGTSNSFERNYQTPIMYGTQNSLAVELKDVAYVDSSKYEDTITTKELYDALGITRDGVSLTISFRVTLITVSGKTLYKDYEIEVPNSSFDISGSAFQSNLITEDVTKMEPFLEK